MGGDEDAVGAFLAVASAREAKLRHRAVRPTCISFGGQMLTHAIAKRMLAATAVIWLRVPCWWSTATAAESPLSSLACLPCSWATHTGMWTTTASRCAGTTPRWRS